MRPKLKVMAIFTQCLFRKITLDCFAQTFWIVCINRNQNLPKHYGFD